MHLERGPLAVPLEPAGLQSAVCVHFELGQATTAAMICMLRSERAGSEPSDINPSSGLIKMPPSMCHTYNPDVVGSRLDALQYHQGTESLRLAMPMTTLEPETCSMAA